MATSSPWWPDMNNQKKAMPKYTTGQNFSEEEKKNARSKGMPTKQGVAPVPKGPKSSHPGTPPNLQPKKGQPGGMPTKGQLWKEKIQEKVAAGKKKIQEKKETAKYPSALIGDPKTAKDKMRNKITEARNKVIYKQQAKKK